MWGYEDDEDVMFKRGAGGFDDSTAGVGAAPMRADTGGMDVPDLDDTGENDGDTSRLGPVDREHFYSVKVRDLRNV